MPRIIFNNKNIFYVHIPKTSGTSLYANLLAQNVKLDHYNKDKLKWPKVNKLSYHHLDLELLKNYNTANKFTIIRNPKDRFLSAYLYKFKKIESLYRLNDWFSKFINILKKNHRIYDNHFNKQINFLDKNTKIFIIEDQDNIYRWISSCLEIEIKNQIIKNKSSLLDNYYDINIKDLFTRELYKEWLTFYSNDIKIYHSLRLKY